ncbi:MAG: glycine cleavage system aminomethyltransferase GcvT [Deltaproteobacteria bacterium]|nr:glycine cleavage system aminomethyltransferase GcvT [Deltaproteobacteria bacterium]
MAKKTPFYEQHLALGAKIVEFAGYLLPVKYTSIADEHNAVRKNAGIFDVSHMGEIVVKGPGATAAVQSLLTNDVEGPPSGKAIYSPACLESGGIVDDMIAYKKSPEEFFICVNASNKEKDFEWFRKNNHFDCEIYNLSEQYAQIAVQGPKAIPLIGEIFPEEVSLLKPFSFKEAGYKGIPVLAAATGYTGEKGFEIYLPNEVAPSLWTTLIEKGNKYGLAPVGLGARDTLRLEMKYCLYGNDIDETTTPLEAGLDWTVKFDKGEFTGRDALLRQKSEGLGRTLCGFKVNGKGIPRHGYKLFSGERDAGIVTSGTLSPSLGYPIGMAYVNYGRHEKGTRLELDLMGLKRVEAEIVGTPFYKPM